MTDVEQQKKMLHPPKRTVEYLHRSLKQNWTTGVLREELALLESLSTGRRLAPNYVFETETQYAFKNPKLRSISYLKHIEQNRFGRYAYIPKENPPRGIVPNSNEKAYPEVIPRFYLPKMPY